jgi:sugar lactone lactonase YvrE
MASTETASGTTMIEALPGTACIFGEAPVWDARAEDLYWIDCLAPALLRHNPASGKTERIGVKLPFPVTGLVKATNNCLVAISSDGLFLVNPDKQQISPLPLRSACTLTGANDGKCDRQGRLWVGTGDSGGSRPPGHLLRIDPDLHAEVMDNGFSIPNGPAFSTDGRRMYLADSAVGRIYRYPVEPATGALGVRECFAAVPEACGAPDGMTVDETDHLWVALYAGSTVLRYTAQGVLE